MVTAHANGKVNLLDLNTQALTQVGQVCVSSREKRRVKSLTRACAQHQTGLQTCKFVNEINAVVSGGWDKGLQLSRYRHPRSAHAALHHSYWDCRQSTPALSVAMPHPIYAMDMMFVLSPLALSFRG